MRRFAGDRALLVVASLDAAADDSTDVATFAFPTRCALVTMAELEQREKEEKVHKVKEEEKMLRINATVRAVKQLTGEEGAAWRRLTGIAPASSSTFSS